MNHKTGTITKSFFEVLPDPQPFEVGDYVIANDGVDPQDHTGHIILKKKGWYTVRWENSKSGMEYRYRANEMKHAKPQTLPLECAADENDTMELRCDDRGVYFFIPRYGTFILVVPDLEAIHEFTGQALKYWKEQP